MGTEPQVVVAVTAGILSLGLAVLVSGRAGPRPPEFWGFMKIRKRWWLGPIIMMLAMLALLVVLSRGGAGAALIYSLL